METWENISQRLITDLSEKQNQSVISQIQELVSEGVLEIEVTPAELIKDESLDGYKIQLRQGIKVVPKEKELIAKLKQENKQLKSIIEEIKELIDANS